MSSLPPDQLEALLRKAEALLPENPPAATAVPQVEYIALVKATQRWLIQTFSTAGLTQADLFAPLGFADRSGISRILKKTRMSLLDTVKIMVLAKTYSGSVSDEIGSLSIAISPKVKTMQQCDELLAALRKTDPRPPGVTWAKVSQDLGYSPSSLVGGRLAFTRDETPLAFFIQLARLYGAGKFECKTESGLWLRLEIN